VGSDNVSAWYPKGRSEVDLRRLPFAKNPAFDIYFNSLVNLGAFVADEEYAAIGEEEAPARSFDDLELAPLGEQLAKSYSASIGRLAVLADISSPGRRCGVAALRQLGRRGGLCELAASDSMERGLLRDLFLARIDLPGSSHRVRKQSLLLIMEVARQLSPHDQPLTEVAFGEATYFGEVLTEGGETRAIEVPEPLRDIAARWRMFYFHHYMSVALEGMFAWVVAQVAAAGLGGARLDDLAGQLKSKSVQTTVQELLGDRVGRPFDGWSTADLLGRLAGDSKAPDPEASRSLDQRVRAASAVSEVSLEALIRSGKHAASPSGLAVPLLLLGLSLSRYAQWEETDYGNWLANTVSDPYLDLVPPLVAAGLTRRFGNWWTPAWEELAAFVLSRYVVHQHQSMSYEKSAAGDRCLLQVEGDRVSTRPSEAYEKIGMGNPRFPRAVRILRDLGLLEADEHEITRPTDEGLELLRAELRALSES
jgi:hypothetical protein